MTEPWAPENDQITSSVAALQDGFESLLAQASRPIERPARNGKPPSPRLRATWLAFQVLQWMYGKPSVTPTELHDFIAKLHTGQSDKNIDLLIKYMSRLSVIDTRGATTGTAYYITLFGEGLLLSYRKEPPQEPAEDDKEI